jgi:hypothetical protein
MQDCGADATAARREHIPTRRRKVLRTVEGSSEPGVITVRSNLKHFASKACLANLLYSAYKEIDSAKDRMPSKRTLRSP